MMRYVLSIVTTLLIIYVVPFVLYAAATVVWDLEPADDAAPGSF